MTKEFTGPEHIDISEHTPVLEPYDKGDRCLIYSRHGNALHGVVTNTSVKEALAYVQGYCDALQDVKDNEGNLLRLPDYKEPE